jgi:adenosylcobinamide-phosphate synthase
MPRPGLALGLRLGTALDVVFADPAKGHPAAGFGTAVSGVESRPWADSRLRGAFLVLLCAGSAATAGLAVGSWVRGGVAVLAELIVRGVHGGEDR